MPVAGRVRLIWRVSFGSAWRLRLQGGLVGDGFDGALGWHRAVYCLLIHGSFGGFIEFFYSL